LDSLYTSSVIAIRPKTGEIVCHYQFTPNDVYAWTVPTTSCSPTCRSRADAQGDDPVEQERLHVCGGSHQLQARRRASLHRVNWATGVDLATGRPQLTGVYKDFLAGDEVSSIRRALELGTDRVQPEQGAGLRRAMGLAARPEACAAEGAGDRQGLDRR